ncbi:YsnF/AvaK domain-containing protein [Pseudobacteroides cellulosolvens]|uniref:DUF2382 domain-containing protein n=1 Tax=Pseudobacteroides cellulosolvens ATCC 35603 = DSM 2933 TaxID=398512 RepID=A0A0L6JQH2_9FIRM|nr:YsnF/AvaK domain-containing protein [Pseudobacteroides cellulosolvens]KNY28038.1 Conserved hypothetical protein CHP02271 [Pseudobacteroides cellulosolvens ATCC 35603 = DSM 2933]
MAENHNNHKLFLREEQLDISKEQVKTGEVIVHKEVVTEDKCITVPVTREEIVIEKRVLAENKKDWLTETIRIPVSEERIEVIKHPVLLEDVEIYQNIYQNTQHIKISLKKEKVKWTVKGNPKIHVR